MYNLAEICYMGQLWGTDFEFEQKIRYEYDLNKKKAISYEDLSIFAKHSLTKVLSWRRL